MSYFGKLRYALRVICKWDITQILKPINIPDTYELDLQDATRSRLIRVLIAALFSADERSGMIRTSIGIYPTVFIICVVK